MIAQDLELHVSARKLLGGLAILLVPLAAVAMYTATEATRTGRDTQGGRFATVAAISASDVSRYIYDRVISVRAMAHTPMVVDAVLAANRSTPNESDAAFQERVQRMETIWNTDAALPFARTILDAPASRFFRDQIAEDRRFLRTILTGKAGTVIGASHKTLDYYQADEDPWRAAYAEGRGAVYISEIRFDAVTKHNYVYIAVPVVQANSTEPIGVLEVLIDVAGLLPAIPRNTGDTAFRRYLVASDGTVISGPDGELFSMKVQSPELAAVREQVPNLAGASGFVLTEIQGRGEELIGYADTGLGAEYKLLDTHVLVAQEASSALASVNKLILLVWILALSAIALLTLGVAYFSLHRKVKFEDIGQALQPESSKPTA